MKHPRIVLITFVTLLLTFAINFAKADSNPKIVPPDSTAYGKNYAQWSAAWMKWAVSIPKPINPLFDSTGAYAGSGQSGKVFFLAGTTTGGNTVRNITVPTGTPLFFPVVNYMWVNTPETGDPVWSPTQEADARSAIAGVIDTANHLSLKIDGHSVSNMYDFRIKSTAAKCNIPPLADDNVFGAALINNPYHCVADGYWVLLPPLSAGLHKIQFTGELALTGFSLDVTYNITVKKSEHKEVKMPLHPRD
jgi:hypothetical protein